MSDTYDVEYTDLFGGEANYSWVRRAEVTVPELTHYGFDGSCGYAKAWKRAQTRLMREAKRSIGLAGVRGVTTDHGDTIEFRPYGRNTIMFVTYRD